MSLLLSSSRPQTEVKTHVKMDGLYAVFPYDMVSMTKDGQSEDVPMNDVVDLCKQVVSGVDEGRAGSVYFQRLGDIMVLHCEVGDAAFDVEMSLSDLYCLFGYVFSNSDIYGQEDRRLEVFKWLQTVSPTDLPTYLAGGAERQSFLTICQRGTITEGYNGGANFRISL